MNRAEIINFAESIVNDLFRVPEGIEREGFTTFLIEQFVDGLDLFDDPKQRKYMTGDLSLPTYYKSDPPIVGVLPACVEDQLIFNLGHMNSEGKFVKQLAINLHTQSVMVL